MRYVIHHRDHPHVRNHPSVAHHREWIVWDTVDPRIAASSATLAAAGHICRQLNEPQDDAMLPSTLTAEHRAVAERFAEVAQASMHATATIANLRNDVMEDLVRLDTLVAENDSLRERLEKIKAQAVIYQYAVKGHKLGATKRLKTCSGSTIRATTTRVAPAALSTTWMAMCCTGIGWACCPKRFATYLPRRRCDR